MIRYIATLFVVLFFSATALAQWIYPPIGPGSLVPLGPSLPLGSGLPSPDFDINFLTSAYTGCSSLTNCVSETRAGAGATDLLPASASGAAFTTYSANQVRYTVNNCVLIEEARTNSLLNSTAPATQTTASLGTGTYTLWVNGAGSATSSAGTATGTGFGAAVQGQPNTFVLTIAGTVVVTVSGSLNAFQLENGAFGTSLIITTVAAVTRAIDNVPLAAGPAAPFATITAGTVIVQTNAAESPSGAQTNIVLGNSGNRAVLERQPNIADTLASFWNAASSTLTNAILSWTSRNRTAFAWDSTGRSLNANGGIVTSDGVAPNAVVTTYLGTRLGTSLPANMCIERITIWKVRLTSAQLQSQTLASNTVPSSYFGLHFSAPITQPTLTTSLAVPAAVARRVGRTTWRYIETANGTFAYTTANGSAPTASLDAYLSGTQALGLPTDYDFRETPTWAGGVSGQTWVPSSSTSGDQGNTNTLGSITAGSGGVDATYQNVAMTGGTGSGAIANVTVSGGAVTAVTLQNGGTNLYKVGDTLSASSGNIGGVTGFSVPVASVTRFDFLTAFINSIVTRYGTGANPEVTAWEAMNEFSFFNNNSSAVLPALSMSQIVLWVKALYPAVKAIAPSSTVASPSSVNASFGYGPTIMAQYLAAGGNAANMQDVMAVHLYPTSGSVNVGNIIQAIKDYKTQFSIYGVSNLPFWDTESSWGINSAFSDATQQAIFAAKTLLVKYGMGISRVYWYAYDDNVTNDPAPPSSSGFGTLWTCGSGTIPPCVSTLTQAGTAYVQMTKWMQGAFVGQYTLTGTIYTVPISRPGYAALAVWDEGGGPTAYTLNAIYTQCRDITGAITPISGSATLTASPQLCETGSVFNYLLARDLAPSSNDNAPMYLAAVG